MRKRIAWHRSWFWGAPERQGDSERRASRKVPIFRYSEPLGSTSQSGVSIELRDLLTGASNYVLGKIASNYVSLSTDVTLSTNDGWHQVLSIQSSPTKNVVVMVVAAVTFSVNLSSTGGRALHIKISSGGQSTSPEFSHVGYSREWVYTNAGTRLVTMHSMLLDTRGVGSQTYYLYAAADNVSGVTVKGTPSGVHLSPSQHAKTAMWLIELGSI